MQDTTDVARKLWSLCSVLRDEGVTYHEYLNELSYLLFLKLADELDVQSEIPPHCRWDYLTKVEESGVLDAYHKALGDLAVSNSTRVKSIFSGASSKIRTSSALALLVRGIDNIDWYRARQNGLGDVYEGLIEKNAQESRYGAGQYFTPRPVVDALVKVLRPGARDIVYDPAAGTAGFLVAAGLFAREHGGKLPRLHGTELVQDVQRMALMNLMLHEIEAEVACADTLSRSPNESLSSLILTNPPYGLKGALSEDQKLHLDFPTSNKQLAFLQHCYKALAEGGSAAIVVPDNVLFERGVAELVRSKLLDSYRVHTILTLPTGIFYATGIRTSVIFFCNDRATDDVWFYNLRDGSRSYGKRSQLDDGDLHDFVERYGQRADGTSPRKPTGRFFSLDREQIRASGDRLDMGARAAALEGIQNQSARNLLDSTALLASELAAAQSAVQALEDLLKPFSLGSKVDRDDRAVGMQ